ncbi:MAG: hypothetical protein IJB02_06555 [Oscillospiraceae bacterium]|nr:hypothetical protein [Oscillospiraceae bacterium]
MLKAMRLRSKNPPTAVPPSEKFLAALAPNFEAAKKFYDKGYSLVYMMSDAAALVKAANDNVKGFREYIGK